MRRLILLTGLLVASSSIGESAPMTSPFRVGSWSGGVYANDQTKAFDRCAATIQDAKGTAVTYSVNHQYQWGVALTNPTWNFIKGASLNLVLKIGQGVDLVGTNALAIDKSVLEIQVKDAISLFSKLRAARELRVAIGGVILELGVGNGDEVLSALTQCAMRATRFRQTAKSKNSIFDSRDSTASDIQDEAKTLVSNIIAYAASRNSQILPTTEDFSEIPVNVAWKTGLVIVGVTVLDTPAAIEHVQDALVERGVGSCRGGFFFAPLRDTIDQSSIARIFTTCQTPEAVRTIYHLVIERPKGGFYVLSMRTLAGGFGGVAQKAIDEYEEKIRPVLMIAIKKLDGG